MQVTFIHQFLFLKLDNRVTSLFPSEWDVLLNKMLPDYSLMWNWTERVSSAFDNTGYVFTEGWWSF